MLELLPFVISGAVFSALTCVLSGWTGWMLALMLVVLYAAFFLASIVLYILVTAVIAAFVDRNKPQERYQGFYWRIMYRVMMLIMFFCRIRVRVSGLEKLPEGRFLLVGNHSSNFDPIITGYALKDYRLAFVSKPQNFKIPLVGGVVHKCCFLPIDRENDRAALKTILDAAAKLKSGLVSFCVYPEGTRDHGSELLPFRNGAFKIAQKAKVPIVTAALKNADTIWKNWPFKRSAVRLEILEVMDTDTVAALKTAEIGEHVRALLARELA